MSGRYRVTSQALADRVIDLIVGSFALLGDNPDLGTKRDDLRAELRIFSPARPAHNYVVLYYQAPPGVDINGIVHGARDWPTLIARGER
jgi:plasmid stabilization system protein ParE